MTDTNPREVTVYGRLSFPKFTAQEAFDFNKGGKFPDADVSKAKPNFQVHLNQAQFDRMYQPAKDFLTWTVDRFNKGEKKYALEAKHAKVLSEALDDLEQETYNIPVKAPTQATLDLAPDTVATLKCLGQAGTNIEKLAIVRNEKELSVPDPDLIFPPFHVVPIAQSVHTLYQGCYVNVTMDFYTYFNGKNPGFSAGASAVVFRANAPRFGGGVAVDMDEVFAD